MFEQIFIFIFQPFFSIKIPNVPFICSYDYDILNLNSKQEQLKNILFMEYD